MTESHVNGEKGPLTASMFSAEGQLIIGGGSCVAQRLAQGTNGYVLRSTQTSPGIEWVAPRDLDNDSGSSLHNSTLAVAVEAGDAVAVTLTIKDSTGAAVSDARVVECWLSSSATTGALATDDGITVTATTGSLLKEHTDDLIFKAVTNTSGVLVLSVADPDSAGPHYLWVAFPNGRCKVSAAITLAA